MRTPRPTARRSVRAARRPSRGVLALAAGAAVALLVLSATASGSTTFDLRGTWTSTGTYSATNVITSMNTATGTFTGRGIATNGTGYTWPDSGTVTGSSVTWKFGPYDQLPTYTATCKGTISAGGSQITGTCSDTLGRSTIAWSTARSTTQVSAAAETVSAAPTRGTVLVKVPGAHTFVPLTAGRALAVGAVVDVTHGWVRLGQGAASAQFYDGAFALGRTTGGTTTLHLTGGTPCPAATARIAAGKAAKPKTKEKLWGTGHGKFTTVGSFASASVIGTHWLTWDTCSGTEIHVASGEVRVTDLVKHTSFVLRAPNTYLAHP